MIKWFRKKFMNENNTMQTEQAIQFGKVENEILNQQEIPKNTKRRFEVEIYDKVVTDSSDKIRLEKVRYDKPVIIEASSQKDLQDFAEKLNLCQQTFKILKILDAPIEQLSVLPESKTISNVKQPPSTPRPLAPIGIMTEHTRVKQKPKYYKVGDIEIKNDNGKIYQKQWIKLTTDEADNFRIINSKSNSIFKLNDRHIEIKKWVLVDSNDEITDFGDLTE